MLTQLTPASLITELSAIGALRVLSRQSVRAFKGSDRPLRDLNDVAPDADFAWGERFEAVSPVEPPDSILGFGRSAPRDNA